MEQVRRKVGSSGYVSALWLLIALFCLRVIGQLVQAISPVSWLPPLTVWQGSALPYEALLAIQVAIIFAMLCIATRHAAGTVQRRRRLGNWLLFAGAIYFLGMVGRLIIGLADWSDKPWFNRPIPAFFHLILASYVLLLAAFHLNWLRKE